MDSQFSRRYEDKNAFKPRTLVFISILGGLTSLALYNLIHMRAADAKAAKTSSNLGTKFQQTQQMWSRPTRSMTQLNIHTTNNGLLKANSTGVQRTPTLSSFLSAEKEIDIIDAPIQGLELRRAYDAQCEEIRRLKQQVTVKDRRIRELEEQICRLKTTKNDKITAT